MCSRKSINSSDPNDDLIDTKTSVNAIVSCRTLFAKNKTNHDDLHGNLTLSTNNSIVSQKKNSILCIFLNLMQFQDNTDVMEPSTGASSLSLRHRKIFKKTESRKSCLTSSIGIQAHHVKSFQNNKTLSIHNI